MALWHDIAVRKYIEAGGETRTLDLPGAARSIKKIEFVYRSRGRLPGRATVRVWGHHAKVAEEIADTARYYGLGVNRRETR